MPDVTLNPQEIGNDGEAPSYTALNNTDVYFTRITSKTILHFLNTGASPANVTLTTPGNVAGFAVADQTVAVPATSGDVMVAPVPLGAFADSDGNLRFTQDQTSGVSVAVVQA